MAGVGKGDLGIFTLLLHCYRTGAGCGGTDFISPAVASSNSPLCAPTSPHSPPTPFFPCNKEAYCSPPQAHREGDFPHPNHTFVNRPLIKLITNYPHLSRPSVFFWEPTDTADDSNMNTYLARAIVKPRGILCSSQGLANYT